MIVVLGWRMLWRMWFCRYNFIISVVGTVATKTELEIPSDAWRWFWCQQGQIITVTMVLNGDVNGVICSGMMETEIVAQHLWL